MMTTGHSFLLQDCHKGEKKNQSRYVNSVSFQRLISTHQRLQAVAKNMRTLSTHTHTHTMRLVLGQNCQEISIRFGYHMYLPKTVSYVFSFNSLKDPLRWVFLLPMSVNTHLRTWRATGDVAKISLFARWRQSTSLRKGATGSHCGSVG